MYFYQIYVHIVHCLNLFQSYTGWDTSNTEPPVWGDQQRQQSCNKIHPIQSGADVCVVDKGWCDDEAKQQDNVDSDEGILHLVSII